MGAVDSIQGPKQALGMSFDPFQNPGTWRGSARDFDRELEENAAQHAQLNPDPPLSLSGRVRARLRRALGRPSARKAPPQLDDLWAREEARYRAKHEGKPDAP